MDAMKTCACGREATANGRECGLCYRARLLSLAVDYTPTRTQGRDPKKQAAWDKRLDDYAAVVAEGSQPRTTQRKDIEAAKVISDYTGKPYRADTMNRETADV